MLTRRDQILKLIVEYVVKHAEPVGSKTIIEEYGLPFSSATIRSEMNSLEMDGYLEKTHTSSGRVPSTKGYKYYVDFLREKNMDGEIQYRLQTVLTEKVRSVEDVIKESCQILSEMTSLASIVLGSNAEEDKLMSVQLVPLNEKTATAIFITDKGYVENKTFIIDETHEIKDIQRVVQLLNDRLKDTPISQIIEKAEALRPLISDYIIDNDFLYQVISEAFIKFAKDRFSLYGKSELLKQPEFRSNVDKLANLVEILDKPETFKEINADKSSEHVSVHFSEDNEDIAIVSAKISLPGKGDGNIALVGPTRMDYDKVVTTLEYVAQELEKYFGKKEDKNGGSGK